MSSSAALLAFFPGRYQPAAAHCERSEPCAPPGLDSSETKGTEPGSRAHFAGIDDGERRISRMRRGITAAAKWLQGRSQQSAGRCVFGTLTYSPDVPWSAGHVKTYFNALRKWAERGGFKLRYIWVMELQKNGRPHYHFLVWLPLGVKLPMPDRSYWHHGISNVKWADSGTHRYLTKYLSKGSAELPIPRGARMWGVGGIVIDCRANVRWNTLPLYVRKFYGTQQKISRVYGGGWMAVETGEYLPPVVLIDGAWHNVGSPEGNYRASEQYRLWVMRRNAEIDARAVALDALRVPATVR